jgi:hypothetical protein
MRGIQPSTITSMTAPVLLLFLLLGSDGSVKHGPTEYQDGVLRAFHVITTGSRCSGSGDTRATYYGNNAQATTDTSVRCRDIQRAVYTVQIGDAKYDLSPQPTFFSFKESSLRNHLLGTPVKIRSEGNSFFILVDQRETRYRLVGAQ